MKNFINKLFISSLDMKLNPNEKFTLKLLLENPSVTNAEIAKKMGLTPQAVGKIKKQLNTKGLVKKQELVLDYERFGINIFSITLIKIMPKAFKKFGAKGLDKLLQPVNAIHSFVIPQTNVTHAIIYAFRSIQEYENYFKTLQTKLGDLVEIKESYVVSPRSLIKSSSAELFLKLLEDYGKGIMLKPEISELTDT